MSDSQIIRVKEERNAICRLVVSSHFQRESLTELSLRLGNVQDWDALIVGLERHGLATITLSKVQKERIRVSNEALRTLQGLEIRDRYRWSLFRLALLDINRALRETGVEFACLKGSAIANMVYPKPYFRPMDDIDILIAESDSDKAQRALSKIGFTGASPYVGHLRRHHHLPPMLRGAGAAEVMVELHTQGLSRDHSMRIALDQLTEPLHQFDLEGVEFKTLGHIDHLRLLSRHTFSRRTEIRLLGVMDILQYSYQYCDEIDWQRIKKDHSFIINTLRCLYPLTAVPTKLRRVAPETTYVPKGIGEGMMPLTEIRDRKLSIWSKLKHLLLPSQWWVHVFYNVPPEKSILLVRLIYHPIRLASWLKMRIST